MPGTAPFFNGDSTNEQDIKDNIIDGYTVTDNRIVWCCIGSG